MYRRVPGRLLREHGRPDIWYLSIPAVSYSLIGPIRDLVEVDGYCCGCGTRVIVGDEVLFSFTIPHERGLQIKKDIIKYNLGGILEGTEHCYFRKERTRFTQLEQIQGEYRERRPWGPLYLGRRLL